MAGSNIHELRPKTGSESEKITINLGHVDLGHIDLLVRDGFYANRTDFIRTASEIRRSGTLKLLGNPSPVVVSTSASDTSAAKSWRRRALHSGRSISGCSGWLRLLRTLRRT